MGFNNHVPLAAVDVNLDVLDEIGDDDHSRIISEVFPKVFQTALVSFDADHALGSVVQIEKCGFSAACADVKLVSPDFRNQMFVPVVKLLGYTL